MGEKHLSFASGRQPISQHPLFPAIVALWFGAAFGLASLAIRPALIERLVVATGIDSVIPMATPPLGATTRILIALTLTALGGLVGAIAARRLVKPIHPSREPRPRPSSRHGKDQGDDDAAMQPHFEGAAVSGARTLRRRALMARGEERLAHFEDHLAITGQEARILNLAEFDLEGYEAGVSPSSPPAADPHKAEADQAAIEETATHSSDGQVLPDYALRIGAQTIARPSSEPPSSEIDGEPVPAPGFTFLPRLSSDGWDAGDRTSGEEASPGSEGVVSAREAERRGDDAEGPLSVGAVEEGSAGDDVRSAAERIAGTELNVLSPVELLERLALAMAQRRRQLGPAAVMSKRGDTPARSPLDPATPTRIDRDETDVIPGYIPPRHIGRMSSPAIPSHQDEDEEDENVLAAGYSSLLDLSRPTTPRQPLAWIECRDGDDLEQDAEPREPLGATDPALPASPPPISASPASAPPETGDGRPFDAPRSDEHASPHASTEETEKALRAALATLQRMSGAA